MDAKAIEAWEKIARGAAEAAEGWRALHEQLPMMYGTYTPGVETVALHNAKEAEKWTAEARVILTPGPREEK